MPGADRVIEVLDARIPFSSENRLAADLRGDKPCIQILDKRDPRRPVVTEQWLGHIRADPSRRAIEHSHRQAPDAGGGDEAQRRAVAP